MGRSNRIRPKFLGNKLKEIRISLGLTQEQIIEQLGYDESKLYPQNISGFESGEREPSLPLLLKYAKLAGICLDILADDELDLPSKIPNIPTHRK